MPPPGGFLGPPPSRQFLAEDESTRLYVTCAICTAIATIFFVARVVSRYIARVGFTISDGILLAGLVCFYGLMSVYVYSGTVGVGRHSAALAMADPSLGKISLVLKLFFVATVLYFTTITLIKLSIIAVYYELFGSVRYRRTLWVLAAICIAWWVAFTVEHVTHCVPTSMLWTPFPVPGGHCVDTPAPFIINGATNLLTDVALVLLPVRVVWTMQLGARARLALTFVFLLGAVVCIASAARLALAIINGSDPNQDFVWTLIGLEIWSMVELAVAVAGASLLTLRPLLLALLPRRYAERVRRGTSGSSGANGAHRFAPSKQGNNAPRSGPLARASRASPHTGGASQPDSVRLDALPRGVGPVSTTEAARQGSGSADSLGETLHGSEKEKTIRVTHGFKVEEDPEAGLKEMGGRDESEGDSLNGASTKELWQKE